MLICLIALSTAPMIFANSASADHGAANFLPNAYYDDPNQGGFDTANEVIRSKNAANYISSLLNSRYSSFFCESFDNDAKKQGYTNALDF